MRYIQHELSKYPNIKFLSHTVNPNYDTPEILKQYATKMRIDESNFNFVTGDKDEIYKIAESYFVNASEDELAPGGFLHSEKMMLIDQFGRIRGYYDGTDESQMNDIVNDIKKLRIEQDTINRN